MEWERFRAEAIKVIDRYGEGSITAIEMLSLLAATLAEFELSKV